MEIPQSELAQFQATDREQCGVMLESEDGTIRVVEIPNRADDNVEGYAIQVSDVLEVLKDLAAGEVILGFLHTHLPHHPPTPSDDDFEGAEICPEFLNCVYQPSSGSLIWYGALTEVTET